MEVLCKLFSYINPASDNSRIPVDKVREYLNSDAYEESIRKKNMLGGITHYSRILKGDQKGVIGRDDNLWIENNATHVITKISIGDDGWVYANIEIFDENQMDQETAEKIRKIKGLIRQGVKLGLSSVVVAYWTEDEVCEKLISIKGADWTHNEAFKGASVVEVLGDDESGGASI